MAKRGRKKMHVVDLEKYPLKVGDWVKINKSGFAGDTYQVTEMKDGRVLCEDREGSYVHRMNLTERQVTKI